MTKLPLRPNVCMIILNSENHLLLGERYGEEGIWQFPQGGVEDGGSLEENVYREIEEELGIGRSSVEIIMKLSATHEYDFATPPPYAIGKWRGQSQTFWLVRFSGHDSEINVMGESPEFSSIRWCTPDEVRRLAEPKRKPGYEAPLRELEASLKKIDP